MLRLLLVVNAVAVGAITYESGEAVACSAPDGAELDGAPNANDDDDSAVANDPAAVAEDDDGDDDVDTLGQEDMDSLDMEGAVAGDNDGTPKMGDGGVEAAASDQDMNGAPAAVADAEVNDDSDDVEQDDDDTPGPKGPVVGDNDDTPQIGDGGVEAAAVVNDPDGVSAVPDVQTNDDTEVEQQGEDTPGAKGPVTAEIGDTPQVGDGVDAATVVNDNDVHAPVAEATKVSSCCLCKGATFATWSQSGDCNICTRDHGGILKTVKAPARCVKGEDGYKSFGKGWKADCVDRCFEKLGVEKS